MLDIHKYIHIHMHTHIHSNLLICMHHIHKQIHPTCTHTSTSISTCTHVHSCEMHVQHPQRQPYPLARIHPHLHPLEPACTHTKHCMPTYILSKAWFGINNLFAPYIYNLIFLLLSQGVGILLNGMFGTLTGATVSM